MKGVKLLVAAALALLAPLVTPVGAAPQKRTTAANWSRMVVATPEGGFRMGNPKARVKLVEYASLTCPHCRQFAQQGVPPLIANHVRGGKVSYEFRNFVLNGPDIAATLAARCGGARTFFPIVHGLYEAQPTWLGRITSLGEEQKQELATLSGGAQLSRIAQLSGIVPIAAKHGVPSASVRRCLMDAAALKRIGALAEAAKTGGITATPTFFINGKATEARDWESLQPLLKAAGG